MKKTTLLSITGLLAIGLMFGVNSAQAQAPGTLDPSFGTGGTVTTNVGGVVSPLATFEQSNGNIAVVAGLESGSNEENFALVRYTSNGTLIGTTTAAFSTMASIVQLRPRYSPMATSW
jgi:Mn2+/Fe2+ NRAMP family transporter